MTEALDAFMSKWGNGVPLDSANATIRELDAARVSVGKRPLTADQTLAAAQAARTRRPFTPQPQENPLAVWSNITSDISDLVRGIPKLPAALVGLGQDIISKPLEIPEGGNIADMPAAQLIPGAFVASALLPGGIPAGDIATRPVTSALDVLPIANKALMSSAEAGLRQIDSGARLNSYQTAVRLKERMATPGDLPQLNRAQRRALQIGVASGEGKRVIPDLMSRRVWTDNKGRAFIGDAHWLSRLRQGPGKELLKFSPTTRSAMSNLRASESTMVQEAQTQKVALEAREWSNKFHEQYTDPVIANEKFDTLYRAFADPDSFGMRNPDDAMSVVKASDPDLVPYFDDMKKLIDDLTESMDVDAPSIKEGWDEPVIARYERDGNIYTHAQHNRLVASDKKVARHQRELQQKATTQVGDVRRRLVKAIGAEAYDLIKRGDEDAALAALKSAGVAKPKKHLFAAQALNQMEAQIEWLSTASVDDILKMGVPEKLSYNTLGELNLLTPGNWKSVTDAYQKARISAKSRIRIHQRTRPGAEATTAERIKWQNYEKNLETAQTEMPAKWGTEKWAGFKRSYRNIEAMTDSRARTTARRRLMNELGDDYRYLHYIVPDDALWQGYSKDILRQKMSQQLNGTENARLVDEAYKSLAEMSLRDDYRPAYIPRVPLEEANKVDNTTIRASYMKPQHAKERTLDYAPSHPDLGVSIAYTTLMDHMARRGIPYMVEQFQKHSSLIDEAQLNAMLRAEWETLKANGRTDLTDFKAYLNDATQGSKRRYIPFTPDELFPSVSPTRTELGQLWMPAELESVVRSAVENAMSPTTFSKLVDPVTGLFRTSVLLYSPAWHWNNIMSNIMITALTNPKALAQIPTQWRQMGGRKGLGHYVRETTAAEAGLEASLRGQALDNGTMIYFPEEMIRGGLPGVLGALEQFTLRLHKRAGKDIIEQGLARSRTGIRLWDSMKHSDAWERMVGGAEKVANASLGFNSFFDDMARRGNWQQFYDDGMRQLVDDYKVTHGRIPDEKALEVLDAQATKRALEQTQDWLMDWTQMLPIERSFLRSIFPFYSFTAHIMRAALKFPFDHPLRVSVINSLTMAEERDWQSRYPPVFRQLLGSPTPDDDDEWTGINVHSFNPFRDIGNMLTLSGILGMTNPILGTVFEQMGIDLLKGGPEFNPNFVYDPSDPGGSRFDAGNPIVNLATNLVPQAEIIAQYAGMDEGYRELVRRDPSAANRMLLTGLRLPVIWRTLDVESEIARDEIKRFGDAKDAVSQLDADNVGRYFPKLKPWVIEQRRQEEIRNTTAGQLAGMVAGRPSPYESNPVSAFITI